MSAGEVEHQNPQQNDPLGSTFLLPRTLEGFLAEKGMEFEPIHDFLSSKALNDPTKLLEQATAILNGITEGTEFEFAQQLPPKNVNGEDTANGAEHPKRRRPALGRKRAQFSFKPSQSEPVSHVDLRVDIDNLQDPDDFFAAHERLENAERELKKSRGDTSDDPIQHHIDTAVRRRRPGLLGKTVSYKHLYPTIGGKENLVSSQEEKSTVKGPRPSVGTFDMVRGNMSHPEAGHTGESQERKTSEEGHLTDIQAKGSIAETENRVTALLDELLSTCKELDGGEVVSVLQERLQVKPITVNKISLPDLGSVQRTDLKVAHETISRPRKPLSVLHQATKSTVNVKTPTKARQKSESFRCLSTSPTPPRSPFASMSILQKRFSQEDSMRNSFYMSLDPNVSSTEQPSSVQGTSEQALSPLKSNQLGRKSLDVTDVIGDFVPLKINEKSSSLDANLQSSVLAEGNIVGSDVNLGKLQTEDVAHPTERSANESANMFENDINIISSAEGNTAGSDLNSGKMSTADSTCLSDKSTGETIDRFGSGTRDGYIIGSDVKAGQQPLASPSQRSTDETTIRTNNDMNFASNGLDNNLRDKSQVKDVLLEVSVNPEMEECPKGLAIETLHCIENQPGIHLQIDGQQFENPNISKEHHTEEQQAPCATSLNEQMEQSACQQERSEKEAPPLKRSKRESRSLRQSLAGAGTKVESGVRRSTRIKSRPLEHWRGERFLYGRIHDSLPTIIGMKYSSPDKGGKEPVLKVKSYVSEEYAELVEIAALH